MPNRIIVTDWSQGTDQIIYTTRAALPQVIAGLTNGTEYTVSNTVTSGEVVPSGGGATATLAMTQPADATTYQRSSTTGGAQGKGVGTVPVAITASMPTPVYARLRDPAGPILRAAFKVGDVSAGASTVAVPADARLGWFFVDVATSAAGPWQQGSSRVAMGRRVLVGGQSQAVRYFKSMTPTPVTITAAGLTIPENASMYATYADSNGSNATPVWGPVAEGTIYDSPFAAEFLAREIAEHGVSVALCGHAVGNTAIASWVPGTTNGNNLLARAAELGAWEAQHWHLGGTDSINGTLPADYTTQLGLILDALDARNALASTRVQVLTATGTRATTTSSTENTQRIRAGLKAYADGLPRTIYWEPHDAQLGDNIHQTAGPGNIRFAQGLSRQLRAVAAGLKATGPAITGASRANGSAQVMLTTNATTLVGAGSWWTRFDVYPAGVAPATDGTGALAITGGTLSGGTITLTLGTVPADGTGLNVYHHWHPDPSGPNADVNILRDGSTTDGIPVGYLLQPTTAGAVVVEGSAVVTPPPNPGTGDAAVQGPVMTTEGTPSYAAGKFGQGFSGATAWRAVTTGQGFSVLPAGDFCMEGWVKLDAAVTASNIAFGDHRRGYVIVRSAVNSGIPVNTLTLAYFTSTGGTTNIGGGPVITDGVWRHVAAQWEGTKCRLYVDGVMVAESSTTLTDVNNSNVAFGIGSWGSTNQFNWRGGIDEVAVRKGVIRTGNFTPPTAPFVGNEAGLVGLYHLDGNVDPAAVS